MRDIFQQRVRREPFSPCSETPHASRQVERVEAQFLRRQHLLRGGDIRLERFQFDRMALFYRRWGRFDRLAVRTEPLHCDLADHGYTCARSALPPTFGAYS